jgi:hypothetical protein
MIGPFCGQSLQERMSQDLNLFSANRIGSTSRVCTPPMSPKTLNFTVLVYVGQLRLEHMKEKQSYIGCSVLAVGGVPAIAGGPAITGVPAIVGVAVVLAPLLRLRSSSSYSVLAAAVVFAASSILPVAGWRPCSCWRDCNCWLYGLARPCCRS